MNDQDSDFAKKLTGYLDDGTAKLRAGTAYRLQLARQEALARITDPQRASAARMTPALAGAGAGTGTVGSRTPRSNVKLWLGILLIVAAGVGYQQWQAYQQVRDLAETDAAILSSDLPIDAYLDRGFQNWLKNDTD